MGYDLTAALVAHGYDAARIVHTADQWYTSIGFAPEPASFWERSMITRPRDREVICHPSAWDIDSKDDLRVKACFTVTADDFFTAHHELGHNMYQRAYQGQPFLFRNGANDGVCFAGFLPNLRLPRGRRRLRSKVDEPLCRTPAMYL